MRTFIFLLLLGCPVYGDTLTNTYDRGTSSSPKFFNSGADLEKWADYTWGGAGKTVLWYKKHELVVYFRSYTSGVLTCEPYVFAEKGGQWVRVLTAMTCDFAMEATVEGDTLVLWRLDWPNGKKERTEFLKFDLRTLDAG